MGAFVASIWRYAVTPCPDMAQALIRQQRIGNCFWVGTASRLRRGLIAIYQLSSIDLSPEIAQVSKLKGGICLLTFRLVQYQQDYPA